jgi:anhydro-N-acetylmuramic acid kinase
MMSTHTYNRSETRHIIGLMSGTSVDGVDAVLMTIRGSGLATCVQVLAHDTFPYPPLLRTDILAASDPVTSSVDLICHLNFAVGACFADAALAIADTAGVVIDNVALIGSHGQTIYHIPIASDTPRRQVSTLQIGEPCLIAERTGVTTIADFRPRDMAAGGLGAPLAPYGHYLLFADPTRPKLVQNIGGIANVSVLASPDIMRTLAFDTGPGNMLIDAAVEHATGGAQHYDVDGRIAAQGVVHPDLLSTLLDHAFLSQPPPKATGRETFGAPLWQTLLRRAEACQLAPEDIVRTCTAFTVESLLLNYERFIFPQWAIDEVVVCGGGAVNPVLMTHLRARLAPTAVTTPEDYGYPNAALEAMIFAVLANETWHGNPANIPCSTGAQHPVVLGKIIPGRVMF